MLDEVVPPREAARALTRARLDRAVGAQRLMHAGLVTFDVGDPREALSALFAGEGVAGGSTKPMLEIKEKNKKVAAKIILTYLSSCCRRRGAGTGTALGKVGDWSAGEKENICPPSIPP